MRQEKIEIADDAVGIVCPVYAVELPFMIVDITVTKDEVIFGDRCEVCYACLHNCPKKAIHLPVGKADARFRNEHVTLADIIKSNE